MTSTASKKKILGKTTETASHSKSRFIANVLRDNMLNPSVDENCISHQGDRGRVIVFIDGSNLFYAASKLNTEIDYVKLLQYLVAKDVLVHVFFYTGFDPWLSLQ